ncbi:MAG: hypothetical protein R6V25_02070 [Desulfatiglandales bacterium]
MHTPIKEKGETEEAVELAVKYQIMSQYTNYLVVAPTTEDKKSRELPVLRKVPQMLAAGYGGTGTIIMDSRTDYASYSVSRKEDFGEIKFMSKSPWELDGAPNWFVYYCNRLHTRWVKPVLQITSYDDLLDCNLPRQILDAIRAVAEQYDPKAREELIVLAFLNVLLESSAGGEFNRNTTRAIKKRCRAMRPDEGLLDLMGKAFSDISKDSWGSRYSLED